MRRVHLTNGKKLERQDRPNCIDDAIDRPNFAEMDLNDIEGRNLCMEITGVSPDRLLFREHELLLQPIMQRFEDFELLPTQRDCFVSGYIGCRTNYVQDLDDDHASCRAQWYAQPQEDGARAVM